MFLSLVVSKCLHWAVEIRGLHNQHLNEQGLEEEDLQIGDEGQVGEDEDGVGEEGDEQRGDEAGEVVGGEPGGRARRASIGKILRVLGNLYDGTSMLAILLLVWDVTFSVYCVLHVTEYGPNLRLLFGFEYAILAVSSSTTLWLHLLHVIDMVYQMENGRSWNTKGILVLAIEMWADALKFMFYVAFFSIIMACYGMPLNLLRDLYMSYVNLKKRITVLIKYRELTRNMNDRFRDATDEELEECGHVCIICRDTMESSSNNENHNRSGQSLGGKVLPCGHVFHFECLRSWLQQQSSCPVCRQEIARDARTEPAAATRNNDEQGMDDNENNEAAQDNHNLNDRPANTNIDTNEPFRNEEESTATVQKDNQGHPSSSNLIRPDHQPCCNLIETFHTPVAYEVIHSEGVKVWEDDSLSNEVRVIPKFRIVICTSSQRKSINDNLGESRTILKTADGWLEEHYCQKLSIDFSRILKKSNNPRTAKDINRNARSDLLAMQEEISKLKSNVYRRIGSKRAKLSSSK